MKMPFLIISPKIVLKNLLIKKGGCFKYHAVIADKTEYRLVDDNEDYGYNEEYEDDDVDFISEYEDNEPV